MTINHNYFISIYIFNRMGKLDGIMEFSEVIAKEIHADKYTVRVNIKRNVKHLVEGLGEDLLKIFL